MSQDNKNRGSFWPSYVDIMTTLFAIMLVLFAVSYSRFKVKEKELQVLADHFIDIIDIYDAVGNIDSNNFGYDSLYSKIIFKLDIEYEDGQFDLHNRLQLDKDGKKWEAHVLRNKIIDAGDSIKATINRLKSNANLKKDIKYLVVIEGQSSRLALHENDTLWRNNYTLSYLRAWNLHKYWKENGIDFTNMDRCELVISGSGEEGVPRIKPDGFLEANKYNSANDYAAWADVEKGNQRFLIHIVPVIGKLDMDDNIKNLVEKYRSTSNRKKKEKSNGK